MEDLHRGDEKRSSRSCAVRRPYKKAAIVRNLEEEEDVETHWSRVKSAFTATCEEVLGYQKKKEYNEWISQKSLDLIERRRHLKEKVGSSRTRRSKEEKMEQYNLAAKEVKVSIKKDKESFTKTLAEKAEKAATAGHIKLFFQTTKTLVGKYTRSEMPVKDAGGKAIFEKDAQAARWIEHFTSLLNRPPPTNPPEILEARRDLPINCDTPSHREIVDAIKQLNQGKAAGPDLIPPEALKADVDTTATFLCPLFAKVWTSGKYPIDWKEGHLVKIPKKGDLSRYENYRGITLLSIPGKVFNSVLLNRIKVATDPKLRDEQAGFRSNRSTTDQIATLRIIVEQSLEWNSPLIVNFLD
ncbi:endonuclease-reverse transcriptase [Elysia marginata]|uniref:Endonuclease-reverse transcriptase n=1 Tax=Elysia marginata TaxID=1093978 RepID=A0AAV4ISR0_9GAST|nr:endonuclease-reverse transcriptase [Elysia marginata]